MMKFTETRLKGSYIIMMEPLKDERGGFARTFCKKEFEKINHTEEFVQFNHSYNLKKGTLRGMHYQTPPAPEIKLIRCIKGSVYDVIVDLRKSSATLLNWTGVELSATNNKMIYVPKGFAHGFLTLEDDSELLYYHTNFYTPSAENGLLYNDEKLAIEWPGPITTISEKDKNYKSLTQNFKGIEL